MISNEDKNFSPFLISVGVIVGMIIGSGVFALPFAVYHSGIAWSVLSAGAAFFAILGVHLAYGEIVAHSTQEHRLPGYVRTYLGDRWGRLESIAQLTTFNIILLIYAILGGKFLATLLTGVSFIPSYVSENTHGGTVLFFVLAGTVFLFGTIRAIGLINLVLTIPFVLATFFLAWLAFQRGSALNITSFSDSSPFFSFSVFLFSLAGLSVIADARGVFVTSEKIFKRGIGLRASIVVGTIVPFILYLIFIAAVLALSGSAVTEEAIIGLRSVMGEGVVRIGALVGFFAIFTSYLALGYDLRKIYELDVKIPSMLSGPFIIAIPFFLYFAGFSSFVILMSFVGGFFVAIDGIFVALILRAMRRAKLITHPFVPFNALVQTALIVLFATSALYEFWFQATVRGIF